MEMGRGVSQLKRLNALWAVGFLLDNLHHAREGGNWRPVFLFGISRRAFQEFLFYFLSMGHKPRGRRGYENQYNSASVFFFAVNHKCK